MSRFAHADAKLTLADPGSTEYLAVNDWVEPSDENIWTETG